MKFTIYGLYIVGNGQIISVGQTYQSLRQRLSEHLGSARRLRKSYEWDKARGQYLLDILLGVHNDDAQFAIHLYSDKAYIICALQDRGDVVDIFKIDEIEDNGVYTYGNYIRASEKVWDLEQYWMAHYFLRQRKPMLVDGKLLRRFALQKGPLCQEAKLGKEEGK